MEIVRKKLSADELNPPGVRYEADGDLVQTLVGDTWVDTPSADPRTNTGGLLPPRAGGTAQCDAAANVVAKIKSINDYAIASQDQALIVSGVVSIIALFLPGIGLVAEALWILAELILTIGTINVDDAFTSDVYDDLTCYFDCAADDSGQWSEAAIADVLANINTAHSGVVYNVLSNMFYQLGLVGLNNAGATGEETGDCSACDCSTCNQLFDFTLGDELGWYLSPDEQTHVGVLGSWTGSGWLTTYASYFGGEAFGVSFNCDAFSFNFVEVGIQAPDGCVLYLYMCNPDGTGLVDLGGDTVSPTEYSIRHIDTGAIVPGEPKVLLVFCTTAAGNADCTMKQVGLNRTI